MERLGRLDQAIVLRALSTWIGNEVIKAVDNDTYVLLETVDDSTGDEPKTTAGRNSKSTDFIQSLRSLTTLIMSPVITEEAPDSMIVTAQQQEEEQMRVYWKVQYTFSPC